MFLEKKSIRIELPDTLEKFDYCSKIPFYHFIKKRFIDADSYKKIASEIHNFDAFDYVFAGKGEKSKRSINGSNVLRLPEGVFKNFCTLIIDKEFYKWFKKTHMPHFRNRWLNIYTKNPRSLYWRIYARLSKFLKLPLSVFYTEIEYSSIKTGGFIPPHTDSMKKRLSFVLYLPDPNLRLTHEMKRKLGTVFWDPKDHTISPIDRFDCSLLMGEERSRFYRDYKEKFVADYEPNSMVGFIKSSKSWHSVEPWSFIYDRRAIVINVWII